MNEARRMATHLKSLRLAPRSKIAVMAKNQAHWILADLAISARGARRPLIPRKSRCVRCVRGPVLPARVGA
jgi:long-subunit acyl-CoA synthetase (AMP-forming)